MTGGRRWGLCSLASQPEQQAEAFFDLDSLWCQKKGLQVNSIATTAFATPSFVTSEPVVADCIPDCILSSLYPFFCCPTIPTTLRPLHLLLREKNPVARRKGFRVIITSVLKSPFILLHPRQSFVASRCVANPVITFPLPLVRDHLSALRPQPSFVP